MLFVFSNLSKTYNIQISIDIIEIKGNINASRRTMNATELNGTGSEQGDAESWLDLVRRQVGSLNFGVVQIVVHAARVVQIERTKKIRLETPCDRKTGRLVSPASHLEANAEKMANRPVRTGETLQKTK